MPQNPVSMSPVFVRGSGFMLCHTPSDTLHYITQVNIHVLYAFRAQAGWAASRLAVIVLSGS
jgi:hypothetical protein